MTEYEISQQIISRLGLSKRIPAIGQRITVRCPYHIDRHPSASIKILENGVGLFHCFSCQKEGVGTLRRLWRDLKGISINKELGIPFEKQDESDNIALLFNPRQETEPDFSTPDVHISLSGTFIPIEKSEPAQKYLKKRCIPLDVAEKMKMRYAVIAKTFDSNEPENKKKWVNFSNRLVIPVYENSKLMTCEGRDIEGEVLFKRRMALKGLTDIQYKKCIYPTGASTSTLYQVDKLDRKKTLYFCEGLMDLAILRSSKNFDETNSTSIFGAGLTARQIHFLKEFDSFVYIIDNDLAGFLSLQKLFKELAKDQFFWKKTEWRFLEPPFHESGVKDVGDIPVKTGKSIDDCLNMRWLSKSKAIVNSQSYIENRIKELQEEKRKCESV